ncbi:MAG: NADH-quinone oxidoreductase subunit C [Desulfurococcales archaeon]|nr:NADH-quinone oxidoreductase subunit C [Desulfurococcales archaeon]
MSPEELVERIKSLLGEFVKDVKIWKNDYIEVEVDKENIEEVAKRMKEFGFDHVKDLTVVDYMKEGFFRIIYNLGSYDNFELSYYIVGIAYNIPRDKPVTKTLYYTYTSADFQEREAYEAFGIIFEGHPDLRPVLLSPPVAELKPLRKDFVVKEDPEIITKKK